MNHTLQRLSETCRANFWSKVLLGGAIALSPALAFAGDKDKDKNRQNQQGQTSSIRQGDKGVGSDKKISKSTEFKASGGPALTGAGTGGGATTMSAPRRLNKHEGDGKNQTNFGLMGESNKTIKSNDLKLNQNNLPSESLTKKGFNANDLKSFNGNDSNKKTIKSGELNGPNQQSDLLTKKGRNTNEMPGINNNDSNKKTIKTGELNGLDSLTKKGRNTNDLLGITNGDSNKKTLKPGDLKGIDKQIDLTGKKNHASDLKDKKVIDADKNLSDKLGKKLQKANDSKDSNHADSLNKKLMKDDHKLAKIDSDKDDGKKKGNFLDQHKSGKFDGVVKGAVAKKLDLHKQFNLKHTGDLTLKMNLAQKIKLHGGWSKSHWAGLIGPGFGVGCSPIVYCGPGYFPSHCLYPGWTPWVEFCWGFHCDPIFDPRPWFCRPWIYAPCPTWVYWDYPVWYELPVVCGTWVDVEPVVINDGLDLQLLAVRFVDPGHPELGEGPRFRIWGRNNSGRTILKDFNILLMASNDRVAVPGLPQAGVRVESIEPGEIKAFDIRLPVEATIMGRDAAGNAIPFSQLHAIVDSHREVPEIFEENNGAIMAREDILPVDPVIFGANTMTPIPGTELNIAGEGFGPEPGQVLVHVGGIELQAEIEGWYDLGVRVRVPSLALAGPTDAELVLIRGDTAASNPLTVQLTMPVASR